MGISLELIRSFDPMTMKYATWVCHPKRLRNGDRIARYYCGNILFAIEYYGEFRRLHAQPIPLP